MKLCLLALFCVLLMPKAYAQSGAHADHAHERMKTWQAILAKPSLAVAVAFDDVGDGGRLWRVAAQDGYLLASH